MKLAICTYMEDMVCPLIWLCNRRTRGWRVTKVKIVWEFTLAISENISLQLSLNSNIKM